MMVIKFSDIPISERPREKLKIYGANRLSNEELLMVIIKSGNKNYSVKDISNNLLNYCGGLGNIQDLTYNKLLEIPGIGEVKALELISVIELMRRFGEKNKIEKVISCTNPVNIINYFSYLFKDKKQEEFYVLYLNNKKNYLEMKRLFVGSIDSSIAHPREIFKNAYLLSASYIICIHNHPSGDATPSREDIVFTKNLYDIGNIHAIYLVDHIIIGDGNYYSFFEDNNIIKHNK